MTGGSSSVTVDETDSAGLSCEVPPTDDGHKI